MKKIIIAVLGLVLSFALGFYFGNREFLTEKEKNVVLIKQVNDQFRSFIDFYLHENKEELQVWYFDDNGNIVQDIEGERVVSFDFMLRMNG